MWIATKRHGPSGNLEVQEANVHWAVQHADPQVAPLAQPEHIAVGTPMDSSNLPWINLPEFNGDFSKCFLLRF